MERNVVYILQNTAPILINIKKFKQICNSDIVLLTNFVSGYDKEFDRVEHIDDFNLTNVLNFFNKDLEGKKGNSFNIITNDESVLILLADLKLLLKIKGGQTVFQAKAFTDKLIMKKRVKDYNIKVPNFVTINFESYRKNEEAYLNELEAMLKYPLFAKPINSAGSKNVKFIKDRSKLNSFLHKNQFDFQFELDEFINSEELYHVDSIVKDGDVFFSKACKYTYPNHLFLEGKPLGTIPVIDEKEIELFEKYNKEVLKSFEGISDGVYHNEIFKLPDNSLVFLEIASRAPGAGVSEMYEIMHDINLELANYLSQLNIDFSIKNKGVYAAWIQYPILEGNVIELKTPNILSNSKVEWNCEINQAYNKATSVRDYGCRLVIWNENYEDLKKDFEYLTTEFKPICFC